VPKEQNFALADERQPRANASNVLLIIGFEMIHLFKELASVKVILHGQRACVFFNDN